MFHKYRPSARWKMFTPYGNIQLPGIKMIVQMHITANSTLSSHIQLHANFGVEFYKDLTQKFTVTSSDSHYEQISENSTVIL